MASLPPPECELGYSREQLETILGDRLGEFDHWMRGQTQSLCDGRRYVHELNKYMPTDCGPHGIVTYPWDLEHFLDGRPIID